MAKADLTPQMHTSAWVFQTWAAFVLSLLSMIVGIGYLPVNNWIKGYFGMGLLFTVGSTLSLAKTTRDVFESRRILSRVDEAKLEKLLAEYDPFKK